MSGARYAYSVYGLAVSSDLALPGLRPATGMGVSLDIDLLKAADIPIPSAEPHCVAGYESLWHLGDDRRLLRYADKDASRADVAPWSIEASCAGSRLVVRWSAKRQLDDIPSIVIGPGLALALQMRQAFLLHASVLAVDDRAILLVGVSGAGKSTTAAALLRRGCGLISDDVAVLETGSRPIRVHAGPKRLRIYKDAARAAGWTEELSRQFRDPIFDDKRYIEESGACVDLTPVAGVYILYPRQREVTAPAFEPLSPRSALPHLLSNVYRSRFLDAAGASAAALNCVEIADRIPIVAVRRPDTLSALPRLADAVLRHATGLARPGD